MRLLILEFEEMEEDDGLNIDGVTEPVIQLTSTNRNHLLPSKIQTAWWAGILFVCVLKWLLDLVELVSLTDGWFSDVSA